MSTVDEEFREMQERLRRRGQAIQAAQLSLNERVREFVADHCRNGSKTGRADYTKFISLDKLESLRVALDEYDRVCADKSIGRQPAGERGV